MPDGIQGPGRQGQEWKRFLSCFTSSPHLTMSPTRPTKAFQLAEDEKALLDIAIRLDSAIRAYKARNGAVDLGVFTEMLDQDLVSDNASSNTSLLTQNV